MTTLTKEDWLNDPTGTLPAGTVSTSTSNLVPSAAAQLPARTAPVSGSSSSSNWLTTVVGRIITNTATDAQRQLTIAGDREPIPLIYGEDRVGGKVLNVVPILGGDGLRYVIVQVLWCYGEITSVDSITINDKPIAETTELYATYPGSQTQGVNSALVVAFSDLGISYNDDLKGFAYTLIWLPENKFTGTLQVAGIVRSVRCYDPRQDAASNKVINSEALDQSPWNRIGIAAFGSGSIVDAAQAPDGTYTAEKITENTANSEHFIEAPVTQNANEDCAYSIYFQGWGGITDAYFTVYDWLSAGNYLRIRFNPMGGSIIQAAAATGSAVLVSGGVESVGNNWFRVYLIGKAGPSSGGTVRPRVQFIKTSLVYQGDGTGAVYLWGLQARPGTTVGFYNKTGASLGTQVLATPSTWTWTDNPALCLANFLASSDYGCDEEVEWGSVIAAAHANDEIVSAEKRRTLNVTFEGELAARDVAETLRNYASCWYSPGEAGIRLLADKPGLPVAAYSHDAGQIHSIRVSKKDLGNLPTVMEVVYTNRDTIPWRDESVFVEIDGVDVTVPRRASKIPLPGINRYSQARREAIERLNKLRLSDLAAVVEVFDIGVTHEPGDIITVQAPQVGLTFPKQMRVVDPPELAGVGIWRLTCSEYDYTVYSDEVETTPNYPDTGLTNPLIPPSTPTGLDYEFEQSGIDIRWDRNPELSVGEYELRYNGTDWASALYLLGGSSPTLVGGTAITWPPQALGTYTIRIKARTSLGVESVNAATMTFTINAPTLATMDAVVEGANYNLQWTLATADLPVKFYRIKRNGVLVAEVQATEFTAPVDWTGYSAVTFEVTPISVCGCPGTPLSDTLTIAAPGQVSSFSGSSVINNVLFYWAPPAAGTNKLPVAAYEMRKGGVWASASSMGLKAGDATFTTWTESSGGEFTYWIAPIDTAGNVGTPVSTVVQVSTPNNFKIIGAFEDALDGTKTNAVLADGVLLAPVYTTETFATHFTNRSWADPEDQVTAGYELYIQPANATGSYVNKYSLAAPIAATMISVVPDYVQLDGTVGITPKIEIADDLAFTTNVRDLGNVWSAFGSDFQYIRVTLTFTSDDGKDLLQLNGLSVNVALQIETDSGTFLAADFSGSGSTTYYARVNFTKDFLDVDSITVAPKVTSTPPAYQITWIIVFDDQPDPTYFDAIFYRTDTGARITTDFTWQATGVL